MEKSKLEKRVGWLGVMVVLLGVMVVLQGIAMIWDRERGGAERVEPRSTTSIEGRVTSGNKVWLTPTPESAVSDELISATMPNYANLEASRMAKRAAVLMGMGGVFTARCEADYSSATRGVETEYSIGWHIAPVGTASAVIVHESVNQVWRGASWAECTQKMLAWKGGE